MAIHMWTVDWDKKGGERSEGPQSMRRTLSTAEICQRIRGNVIHAYLLFHSVARLQCAVAPWNLLTISVHENHPTGLHTIAKLQPKKERTPRKLLPLDFLRPNPAFPLYVLSPLPAAIQSAEQEAAWNTQTKALQPKHYTVAPQALCPSAWPRHPVGVLRMMALIACSSTCRAA